MKRAPHSPPLWRLHDRTRLIHALVSSYLRENSLCFSTSFRAASCYRVKPLTKGKRAAASRGRRLESERQAIHAIAQAGRLWPIVEDMAEMALASMAGHGSAGHAPRMVQVLVDCL